MQWYRMPNDEWLAHHRCRPYYILGQLDHSKEILIPRKKDGQEGFDVLNPLYCYDGGKFSFRNAASPSWDPIVIDRSAVIVNRGWIPYELKDKRSRPWERNTRELTKIVGTWRKSKSVYDYKIPNNPNDNDWHNLCVEDIAAFWELPNANEFKFFYF